MKTVRHGAQAVLASIGGFLGWFLGDFNGLLLALIVFVAVDYLTGVLCAIADHKLCSEIGARGIYRKMLIFLMVGISHVIDVYVIGTGSTLRVAVICFYLSNEGISILENVTRLGLPVPPQLKNVLAALRRKEPETGGKPDEPSGGKPDEKPGDAPDSQSGGKPDDKPPP